MRYLAIDLGGKRTGLAVGDDGTKLASPVDVVVTSNREELLRQLERAIAAHGPDVLVVGLPLNMDGSRGQPAQAAEAFARLLRERFNLPVELMDERLTSYAADQSMSRSGLTRGQKKERRDALAAAALLRDFLERRPSSAPSKSKKPTL